VRSGEFVVLLGKSGSGKTSLLNIIGTIDKPTRGEITVGGTRITERTDEFDLAQVRLSRLGFVFQTFNLLPSLSALENVCIPMVLKGRLGRAERRKRARELLAQVGLADRAGHFPSQLSGGEQQRVTIARALANRPELLLLDEPTGDLDSRSSDQVMRLLLDLNENHGVTLVMVTHDVHLKNVAHRVVHMLDGKVQRVEEVAEACRSKHRAGIFRSRFDGKLDAGSRRGAEIPKFARPPGGGPSSPPAGFDARRNSFESDWAGGGGGLEPDGSGRGSGRGHAPRTLAECRRTVVRSRSAYKFCHPLPPMSPSRRARARRAAAGLFPEEGDTASRGLFAEAGAGDDEDDDEDDEDDEDDGGEFRSSLSRRKTMYLGPTADDCDLDALDDEGDGTVDAKAMIGGALGFVHDAASAAAHLAADAAARLGGSLGDAGASTAPRKEGLAGDAAAMEEIERMRARVRSVGGTVREAEGAEIELGTGAERGLRNPDTRGGRGAGQGGGTVPRSDGSVSGDDTAVVVEPGDELLGDDFVPTRMGVRYDDLPI
jgi:putative ABC transport system ATP-binding protein